MITHVSATEAVRTFSDLLSRIRYRGEEFVVERAGEAICRMTPAAPAKAPTLGGLASLLRELPKPDAGYASDVRKASRSQGRRPQSPWGDGDRRHTMNEDVLRETLVELLLGGHAHASLEQALAGLAPALRGRRPAPQIHSAWEELEHLRIAQEDILRYTLDPRWKSPLWPKGYWPTRALPRDSQWRVSVKAFKSDLAEVVAMAKDPKRDLTSAIPHGEGRTYLRQLLLVADHNAYHVGQIVQLRKLLGAWKG